MKLLSQSVSLPTFTRGESANVGFLLRNLTAHQTYRRWLCATQRKWLGFGAMR